MKKNFFMFTALTAVVLLAFVFAGCNNNGTGNGNEVVFVPVTGITPSFALTGVVNVPITLGGTVAPANATNQTIVWSIHEQGGTSSTLAVDGVTVTLTPTAVGTVVVRATITNGLTETTDYTADFSIVISDPGFDPVTGITLNVRTSYALGANITLSGEVVPSTATFQTITWAVNPTGTTVQGAVIDPNTGVLTVPEAGTVIVTATVTQGVNSPFNQDFTITIVDTSTLVYADVRIPLGPLYHQGAHFWFASNDHGGTAWAGAANHNATAADFVNAKHIVISASSAPADASLTIDWFSGVAGGWDNRMTFNPITHTNVEWRAASGELWIEIVPALFASGQTGYDAFRAATSQMRMGIVDWSQAAWRATITGVCIEVNRLVFDETGLQREALRGPVLAGANHFWAVEGFTEYWDAGASSLDVGTVGVTTDHFTLARYLVLELDRNIMGRFDLRWMSASHSTANVTVSGHPGTRWVPSGVGTGGELWLRLSTIFAERDYTTEYINSTAGMRFFFTTQWYHGGLGTLGTNANAVTVLNSWLVGDFASLD